MSVAFILNPGYNTINNVHHTFWDQDGDAIKNSSLTQALEVSTSVTAPSHVVTGGTVPAQFYMLDATTLATDAPIFKMPIGQAPTFQSDLIGEFTTDAGISVQSDMTFEVDSVKHSITGVDELTCGTLHYTTLDPAIPTAGNWSTFDATSDVNLDGFSITDSTRANVYFSKGITSYSTVDDGNSQFGNSLNNSNTQTSLSVVTNNGKAGARTGSITATPSNKTGAVAYYNNPGSVTFGSDGGDLQLQTYGTGKTRIVYDNFAKAITVNQSGALAFNSTFAAGAPVDGSFGTAGQIIQSNGPSAAVSWVDAPTPGDPSTWSEYPATQTVVMGQNSLSNCGQITCRANDTLLPLVNLITRYPTDNQYNRIDFSASGGVVTGSIGNTSAAPTSTKWDACGSALITKASTNVNSGSIFAITSPNSASALVRNSSGAVSFDSTFDPVSPTFSYGTAGQIVQSNGSAAAPSWVTPAISGQYVFYVAKNGLDTNAGDITHPKLTIQSAINAATSLYPQQVVILIQPGVYSSALSITRPNITLLGLSPSSQQNLLTQIAGNISIACTASQDLYYSQVCIANLLVSGSIIDTSTVVHTLNIEACRIATNGQVFAQISSADNRTRLVKCTLLQASLTADVNPMMLFSSGAILLNQLDVTAKNNCNLVKFNGTATLPTCVLCSFTSDSASTVAEPIFLIAPTNGTNYPYAFGYNAFIYSSYAPKITHPESAGICVSAVAGRPYISVAYNSFALAGTNGSNYAIYDTGYNTATAGYYFYFSNNGGINPAGIHAVIPVLTDFGQQAHDIYGFSSGGSQNKYTLSAVA